MADEGKKVEAVVVEASDAGVKGLVSEWMNETLGIEDDEKERDETAAPMMDDKRAPRVGLGAEELADSKGAWKGGAGRVARDMKREERGKREDEESAVANKKKKRDREEKETFLDEDSRTARLGKRVKKESDAVKRVENLIWKNKAKKTTAVTTASNTAAVVVDDEVKVLPPLPPAPPQQQQQQQPQKVVAKTEVPIAAVVSVAPKPPITPQRANVVVTASVPSPATPKVTATAAASSAPAPSALQQQQPQAAIKKKTKTRSRQKNLRKDHRPDEMKPKGDPSANPRKPFKLSAGVWAVDDHDAAAVAAAPPVAPQAKHTTFDD